MKVKELRDLLAAANDDMVVVVFSTLEDGDNVTAHKVERVDTPSEWTFGPSEDSDNQQKVVGICVRNDLYLASEFTSDWPPYMDK